MGCEYFMFSIGRIDTVDMLCVCMLATELQVLKLKPALAQPSAQPSFSAEETEFRQMLQASTLELLHSEQHKLQQKSTTSAAQAVQSPSDVHHTAARQTQASECLSQITIYIHVHISRSESLWQRPSRWRSNDILCTM